MNALETWTKNIGHRVGMYAYQEFTKSSASTAGTALTMHLSNTNILYSYAALTLYSSRSSHTTQYTLLMHCTYAVQ
jgi:hypothetical protein